jgi:hypothetical protein
MNCRYCNQPLSESEAVPTHAYWNAMPGVCHKECKVPGEKQEAYDCQLIDADCNDCAFFIRDKERKLKYGATGTCSKFGTLAVALPKTCSGLKCFSHRRDNVEATADESLKPPSFSISLYSRDGVDYAVIHRDGALIAVDHMLPQKQPA